MKTFASDEDLRYFLAARDDLTFLIGIAFRPGVMLCASAIEYMCYPPGTPRATLFEVIVHSWSEIPFITIGMPTCEKTQWEPFIGACLLRIADGTPASIDDKGKIVHFFPLDCNNCFSFEFVKDHPIYSDQTLTYRLTQHQHRLCTRVYGGWKPKPDELRDAWTEGMQT